NVDYDNKDHEVAIPPDPLKEGTSSKIYK
ncbi:polyphosphate kinase 2, partial [Francisella tularensis subsp. holarctica]|nr:polyphosphate kinase 2 [Francisella tularensis subsp. holarctica]